MENKEIQEKYGISKKMGIGILVQTILICLALVVTLVGLVARFHSVQRVIVYTGQTVVCIGFILLGFVQFKKRDRNLLQFLLYLYAFLEIFRSAFLNTNGIGMFVSGISRLLLAAIGVGCVLIAERADKQESRIIAMCLLILELVLYLVFIFGYPGMMYGRLNRYFPLVNIFITGSVNLFLQAKFEQLGAADDSSGVKNFSRVAVISVIVSVAIAIASLSAVSYDHSKRMKEEAASQTESTGGSDTSDTGSGETQGQSE